MCHSRTSFLCFTGVGSATSWCLSSCTRFAADSETRQLTFDALVFQSVDERVRAYVQISQEHRWIIPNRQVGSLHRIGQDQEENVVREPANDESHADYNHGLNDVPLDTFRLSLWCTHLGWTLGVTRHNAHLSSHHDNYAPIAIYKGNQGHEEENNEVAASHYRIWLWRVEKWKAHSIFHSRRNEWRWSRRHNSTNPGESHRCIYHPAFQVFLAPERMNHF